MNNHTPGPWKIAHERSDDEEVSPWGCVEVADKRWITIEGRSGDEALANAQLISAAPELLAACEEVLEQCSHDFHFNELYEQAQAAIAKAEGGEM